MTTNTNGNGNGKTKNNSNSNGTKENQNQGTESSGTQTQNNNGQNNQSTGNSKMSPEALARYEKNKEFRERKQKYIPLDSLINTPRVFQFYPEEVEDKEQTYQGEVIERIQYTVTEPMSKYPDMKKFLSLTNARATELIDHYLYEEGITLLRIWKKGQGSQTQYFVEPAQVQPKPTAR